MYISGWAFNSNAAEISAARAARFKELQPRLGELQTQRYSAYNRNEHTGQWPADLSAEDIAIMCDGGNTCFGGNVEGVPGGTFRCTIYTD